MTSSREELQEALCRYTTDTLIHINTLKEFCDQMPQWVLARRKELKKMKDIDIRANTKIIEEFVGYMSRKMCDCKSQEPEEELEEELGAVSKECNRGLCQELCHKLCEDLKKELEKELAVVLKDTLGGLKKLRPFLDAVEQLSVTSLSVFKEENQVLKLPEGINLQDVLVVVMTTRVVCPLLVEFKRDDSEFFLPRLQNVVVLMCQLDKYIWTTKKICEMLQRSAVFQVSSLQPVVDLQGLSDADVERMLSLIDECCDIRNDQHFRMVSLFQEDACSSFIKEFGDRKSCMMQFLTELEESADQLERMNFGAKVSSMVGSLAGAVGGVLSILGLAGRSTALIIRGDITGVISRVSSAVTEVIEIIFNRKCKVKADEVFKGFIGEEESLQSCLKTTIDRVSDLDMVPVVRKVIMRLAAMGKVIDALVDLASALTPTMSATATVYVITVNVLFICMDIYLIYGKSISLAERRETNRSQFIRARAALWRSEVDAWGKISDSLREGQPSFKKKQDILETDFYL